ncbi:hypothetical protein LO763_20100 [Glycomyces sp. A-F 0318]|uniref:hypothetical protein n=1 Tax=Glycomyces amatae TaxID=2881355 RepID=UPI001E61E291|nr:hypothetical protein [Glycomyces amatae]MCD0445917.1 hypothetical protein [Glycomyces amatae]
MLRASKRVFATALIAIATMLGLSLAASPAQAGYTTIYDCPPAYVCFYDHHYTNGDPVYKTQGTPYYSGSVWGVVNNGIPDGAVSDHFYLRYRYTTGSTWYTMCFHYAPGPGRYAYDFPSVPVNVSSGSYWGGEC